MKLVLALLLAMLGAHAGAQPIPAGTDVIDKALLRLLPAPFEARVDPGIPATTVLRWPTSTDWIEALQRAAESAGLRVRPHFDLGRVELEPGTPKAACVVASTVTASGRGAAVSFAVPSTFALVGGQRLDVQLTEWAQRAGWQLIWSSQRTWLVPGHHTMAYAGPVDAAIERAVMDLYANGFPVRLDIWSANKVMEISHDK